MQARFWNFPKRRNSTAIPTGASPWEPQVNLKAPCNSISPTLLMGSQENWQQITSYNYLRLGGMYYFINSWDSVRNDLWEAHCELDFLATYKSEILATTAFVEYDTATNPGIVDHRLSTLVKGTASRSYKDFSPKMNPSGSIVLCVTGESGSVSYFAIQYIDLTSLLNSVTDWASINVESSTDPMRELVLGFLTWAQKSLSSGNAPSNIRGCVWLPWSMPVIEGEETEICFGTFHTGFFGRKLAEPVESHITYVDIPWQATDWRQNSMCHTFEMGLPYAGVIGIDAGMLAGFSRVRVEYSIDRRTGDIVYMISTEDGTLIGSYSGCAGVSIPIGVSSYNLTGIASSVFNGTGALLSGNVGGAVGSLAQAAQNIVVPNMTSIGTQTSGASSGLAEIAYISLGSIFHNTNVTPSSVSAVMGTPTMATKTLSSLSGFVKTRGASVSANCGANVLQMINSALDGGIYIE